MANIAILGSSFSECLYRHKDENEMQKLPWLERTPFTSRTTEPIIIDNENHWVNLLEKKYPQHEFHIFAKGGAGWEYAQQMLHMLAEQKICDRIIVELCDYRAIILSQDIAFNKLKTFRMLVKHYIPNPHPENYLHGTPVSYQSMIDEIKEYKSLTTQTGKSGWPASRAGLKKIVKRYAKNDKIILHNVKTPYVFSTDVLEYMVRSVMSPVYTTRYRNYLSSLTTVWPKVFDKVGVWAYESFNVPYPVNFDANKEYFDNSMQYFEDTMLEEWIRKDPINNSADSWKDKYYGFDGGHLNKEGMRLLVDFLLKQPNIQQVLE
jgi:hypothetical protein